MSIEAEKRAEQARSDRAAAVALGILVSILVIMQIGC